MKNIILLKYALRNIKKRPVLNGIKIVGLSLGLCGILFIALFLKNELTYDEHFTKAKNIFRLTATSQGFLDNNHFARFFSAQDLPLITESIPEVESLVRMVPIRGKLIKHDEQFYKIHQGFSVDNTFFKLFDIPFLSGNINTVFQNVNSVVISKSLAENVFGNSNPIGKVISLPKGHFNAKKEDFQITGVMDDFEQQSHLHPDILFMPGKDKIKGWAYQYLLFRENANPKIVEHKISLALTELFTDDKATSNSEVKAYLMNITDIHLQSKLFREIEPNSSMTNIWVLVIAGIILLLIALSNFASLNLGMVGYLSTFLAMNQILGSSKRFISRYFLIESTVVVLTSITIILLLMYPVNTLIYKNYQLNLLENNELFILSTIVTVAILMIVAGLQPVFKKHFEKISLQKRLQKEKRTKVHKTLFITQFSLAIVLLIIVIVISEQTNFALNKALGAKENIVCLPLVHSDIQKDFEFFKSELLKESSISSVSAMMDTPGSETHDMFSYTFQGAPELEPNTNTIGVFAADYSFAEVFGLTFLGGRNFTETNIDEPGNGEYLINESALYQLGFRDPQAIVNKQFSLLSPVPGVVLPEGKVIGVVKDFHLSGLQNKVEPLVLFKRENSWLNSIVISYRTPFEKEALLSIENIWRNLFPEYPIDYVQVNSIYKNVYKTELIQKKLILLFTLISIFVCTMGVLGLALMITQSRFKEIGIRKVNGASRAEILILLNRNFMKWLVVSFVVASPLAYFAVAKWLESFAYKITLSPWMFLFSGGVVILITLLTVSWQSYKAATADPVKSLRTE
ncbi:ABC transporter permease [Maribacter dokdonensis]|uniref:ABC transporter permease n=1 Tax=Maribacter dokdonensis TaxID=320912 RepID=UPI000719915A|nr:ABC transporter permease [Maribacter dokdonensis]KSA13255.1 Lipoprotein release ABC transporter permease [Maribacter dokdonensis DSW-8]